MKLAGKIVFSLGIVCFLFMYAGCKKHNPAPVPVTDQQLDLLTKGPWKVTAVTLDGTTQMTDYANFALSLTGTKGQTIFNFTTAGRPSLSPWPASGTFTFDATSPATLLSRNDNPPVAVTYAATSTQLTMSFSFAGAGYINRVGNVKGVWVFTFGQ
jgi:hypothetical protein